MYVLFCDLLLVKKMWGEPDRNKGMLGLEEILFFLKKAVALVSPRPSRDIPNV